MENKLELYNNLIKLKLNIDDEKLELNDYNKLNIDIINNILNKSKSKNIIIHPGGKVLFILSVIVGAILQYMMNINDPNNYLFNHINEGDIVEYEGARAIFGGIEGDKFILKYRDLIVTLPFKNSFKLRKYNGNAKTINKYPQKKNEKKI